MREQRGSRRDPTAGATLAAEASFHAVTRRTRRAIAGLLLLAGLAACATPPERLERASRRAAEVMIRSSDPYALAAAGLMQFWLAPMPLQTKLVARRLLIDQALALAPDRPDLAWLDLAACYAVEGCDPTPLESRLRDLDPGNGIAWLEAAGRAAAAHDETGVDVALHAMARSDDVDVYWTRLSARLSAPIATSGDLSVSEAVFAVIGALASMDPRYQVVSNACKGQRLQRPGVLEDCRAVAVSFQRGDTVLTELFGTSLAKRLWPAVTPEWVAADAERRVAHYRMNAQRNYIASPFRVSAATQEFGRLLAQYPREQDLLATQLAAHRIPLDPPQDWIDPTPD